MSRVSETLTVIAAPVPYADRRALSEAWYAALHLSPRSVARVDRSAGRATAQRAAMPARAPAARIWKHEAKPGPATFGRAGREPAFGTAERRCAPSPLARRIVRTFARIAPSRAAAPVSVRAGTARVTVLLRTTGRAVELIALCVPAARPAVERALVEARYALAARGVRLESAVAETPPC